jgi:hypothetical protein
MGALAEQNHAKESIKQVFKDHSQRVSSIEFEVLYKDFRALSI